MLTYILELTFLSLTHLRLTINYISSHLHDVVDMETYKMSF